MNSAMLQSIIAYVKPHRFCEIHNFNSYFSNCMRGSPISNLRQRPDYSTSPYDTNLRNSSPRTGQESPQRNPIYASSTSESDYWRGKARQLQTELMAVNQELLFQIRRNQKLEDLQEKIELLLAQNTHFVDENQNLIRLVQQKNGEIDVWKRKFDSEYNNSNLAEAEKRKVFDHLNIKDQQHQIQIQKLLAEITRLQNDLVEADSLKKIEIQRIKNQYQSQSVAQIQNLRRSQHGNSEMQELNIRKLKDVIDEKDFEIQNLNRQIRLKNEQLKKQQSYSKNELQKLQEQKKQEIYLIKTEFQNNKNNLVRVHKKNEDQLKNLHEAKVKRLTYEIEEKKHQIEEASNRLKKSGKEGEAEIARLINDNASLRNELKDNDNLNRTRVEELTAFYEQQFTNERETNVQRENNLRQFYEDQITILQNVIKAKQTQTKRLLDINGDLKQNEEKRLQLIKENNYQLKHKIGDIVKHYQWQIELTKVKISKLYEADLDSLRNQLQNSYANHAEETEKLRDLLKETRERLARQVQDRLDLRKDYELRLTEIAVSHDKIQRELKNMVSQREKEIEVHTSKASLTHIEHNQLLQTRNINMKQLINEKRNLEGRLTTKNQQIESLNLKVQQMQGLHKRDFDKLDDELNRVKNDHEQWLNRQQQETQDWLAEKKQLNDRIDQLTKQINDLKKKNQNNENSLNQKLNQKGLENARLKGLVQELQVKVKSLGSKNQLQVENVERTVMENKSLMNSEKEKLLQTASRQKQLLQAENDRVRAELQAQINDLRSENDLLLDNYQKSQIRQQQLKADVRNLTDSVNKRGKLQQSVINLGLSNNYFKNVAEIFKREISA